MNSSEYTDLQNTNPSLIVETQFDPELLNIVASNDHIKNILTNLFLNAVEAVNGKGNVTISTQSRYIDNPIMGYDKVRIGEYALLTVSDTGSGISPTDMKRIFEPFYTKKVLGRRGTGLGLTIVWNAIQDHNGYINLSSDENGTTFEVYFPASRDRRISVEDQIIYDDYYGGGERILVVDDEDVQVDIACDILSRLGYSPHSVSSGEEAVAFVEKKKVALILLDMIMSPGMNGRETYEKIISIHPHQKAIIASGFSETDDVKKAQRLGAGRYIKKPYTVEKIGIAIKEELRRK